MALLGSSIWRLAVVYGCLKWCPYPLLDILMRSPVVLMSSMFQGDCLVLQDEG